MNYNEWKTYTLGNIGLDIIDGDRGKNYPNQNDFSLKGFCLFLNTGNVTKNGFDFNKVQFINREKDENLRKGKLCRNDIVLTTRGTLGNVGYYDMNIKYQDIRINSGMVILRVSDFEILNVNFLYQFLTSNLFKDQVISFSSGSAQPQLPIKDLRQIEITLPNFHTQKKIASILFSLDDKIELNRQTNQTLESIAQTLFKEMCLPKSEELPEGWRVGKLGDFMETISKTHKMKQEKIIFLNTSDILEGNILHNNYSEVGSLPGQAKKSIQQNDILLSEIRPVNKRFAFVDFDGKDFVVSTKLMVLRSKGELSPYLFYCYLTSNETLNYLQHLAETRSGTFPQITFTQLEDLEITVPPQQVLENLTHSVESIYKQILQNNKQNQTLISIRDSLLPKLMKGEIEV